MTRGVRVLLAALALVVPAPAGAQTPARVTVIYDAFGSSSTLQKDWGFAALIEYGGRRILFDTGNDATIFAGNVRRLGIDLTRLDAAVVSHRHGDHTTGLTHLVSVNSGVTIYAPQEGAFFRSGVPETFLAPYPDLPAHLRYFDGKKPERFGAGTPWSTARFQIITKTTEILPGFFVITTRSEKPGTLEMNETSLVIRTPRGLAVVVGCSHPGVEKILQQAATIDRRLHTVTGGFHLVNTPRPEVERVADLLRDTLKLERVGPGHCTSELGFAVFLERFKERFDRMGVGATISLP